MAFGDFLSSFGSLPQAYVESKENIAQKEREAADFKLRQRLMGAQATGLEQRNKIQQQSWIPIREYVAEDGSKRSTYLTPTGYQDLETEPSPYASRQKLIDKLGSSLSPQQKAIFTLTGGGLKDEEETPFQKEMLAERAKQEADTARYHNEEVQARREADKQREEDRRLTQQSLQEQRQFNNQIREQELDLRRQGLTDRENVEKLKEEGMVKINGHPVKPTSKMLSNDQLAKNLIDNLGSLDKYIDDHPDQLNKASWFKNWAAMQTGKGNGDFMDMRTSMKLTALPGIGIHGARAVQLAQHWEQMIYDGMISGPEGARRAVEAVRKSAHDFLLDPAQGGTPDDAMKGFDDALDKQILKALAPK